MKISVGVIWDARKDVRVHHIGDVCIGRDLRLHVILHLRTRVTRGMKEHSTLLASFMYPWEQGYKYIVHPPLLPPGQSLCIWNDKCNLCRESNIFYLYASICNTGSSCPGTREVSSSSSIGCGNATVNLIWLLSPLLKLLATLSLKLEALLVIHSWVH